jgi:serine/threonine protein kinase
MEAFSEKIPEIVQKHLVPSVLASRTNDPELRERGKVALLHFASSEVFQELLHADRRAGHALLDAASKILGPPSQENKDSWLQIQQSLERGGAASEAQTIQQRLEEVSVPLPVAESLQTVADLAGFLPKRGMPLQVGNQVYWARPEPSDQGTAFRFFVAEGGQWKEAGSVVMDSQSGAIISAFDGQQQPIMGLLPDLTGCIGEMSKKLRIIQEMTERLKKEGVDPAVAKKIIEQWTDQWRGCVESEDPETGLIVQRGEGPGSTDEERTNRIHGLKIRREESGLCADYTFEDIIEGSYKRVKKMVRINPDGTVVELVRYTRKKSEAVATSDELRERFVDDARKEIGVRKGLVENGRQLTGELSNEHLYDNILWMEDFDSHVGKDQQVKRRYVGERAPGGDLFDYRNKKIKEAENGPPKSLQEQSERFSTLIHLGVGALRGLHQLHARNYVHLDVKPENVLVFDDRAKLADFGLCRPEGTPTGFEGSPGYMPPELMGENENKPRCDRRMDMFSFGAMLLDSVCSVWKEQPMASLADEVYKTNEKALAAHQAFEVAKKAWESNPGDPGLKARLELAKNSLSTALGAMKKAIKNIQPVLQQRKGDPWILIADLIEYDPGKRTVTSEEAEKRLQRVNESLQRGQGLTVPVSSA